MAWGRDRRRSRRRKASDQHVLLGQAVEREAQRLDIGLRIHVHVERRLRHRNADIRAEIGNVLAERGARLDVEDEAVVIGDAPQVGVFAAIILVGGLVVATRVTPDAGIPARPAPTERASVAPATAPAPVASAAISAPNASAASANADKVVALAAAPE